MKHGGDLTAAEAAYGRPRDGWLDLSTGVNPHAYPAPPLPPEAFARAPESGDVEGLLRAARLAYGWAPETPAVAGPGAQAMIQLLPYLRVRSSVAVVGQTYGEHAYSWARAGHRVRIVGEDETPDADVVIVVNPMTPTGRITRHETLARLAADVATRSGLLVVDETYADVASDAAFGSRLGSSGVIVIRSFGKFFGMPGLRLGFAAGDAEMVSELAGELGPWPVSGPAVAIGRAALADEAWIATMRLRLTVDAMRLDSILKRSGFSDIVGCDLFRLAGHPDAEAVRDALARAGVWCRSFEERPGRLRFGLPGDDAAYARLEGALSTALATAV